MNDCKWFQTWVEWDIQGIINKWSWIDHENSCNSHALSSWPFFCVIRHTVAYKHGFSNNIKLYLGYPCWEFKLKQI